MAVSNVRATITAGLEYTFSATTSGVTVVAPKTRRYVSSKFVPTVGATNRVTLTYSAEGTLAASGTADIDLSAAGFATVKGVVVTLTTTTGGLKVGGTGPSNIHSLWFADDSDAAFVDQGGPCFVQGSAAGKTVDGSNKDFRITNTSGSDSAGYTVDVIGLS